MQNAECRIKGLRRNYKLAKRSERIYAFKEIMTK